MTNDVWGTTHSFMTALLAQSGFSSGAYSIIMAQDFAASIYGYVCRVGTNSYC